MKNYFKGFFVILLFLSLLGCSIEQEGNLEIQKDNDQELMKKLEDAESTEEVEKIAEEMFKENARKYREALEGE